MQFVQVESFRWEICFASGGVGCRQLTGPESYQLPVFLQLQLEARWRGFAAWLHGQLNDEQLKRVCRLKRRV